MYDWYVFYTVDTYFFIVTISTSAWLYSYNVELSWFNFSFTRLLIFYFDLDFQIEHQLIFLSCSQLFSFFPISFRQEWKKLYDTFLMLHHDVIKFCQWMHLQKNIQPAVYHNVYNTWMKNRVQIRRCYSDNQLGSLIKAIAQTRTAPDYKSNTFF